MSHATERAEFVTQMVSEGMPEDVARLILRDAQTLQRVAEFECSYPVPGCTAACSENRGSPRCDWHKRDDDAMRRITERCKLYGMSADFTGDPRGNVVKLHLPSGKWNTWGGAEAGYAVPAYGMTPADYRRADARREVA